MVSNPEIQSDFEKVFMPLSRQAYNFAYRLTLDPDDAKDLVQDTFIKAFRFYNSFQKGTNAKAWLFRILKNTFINNYRKKSKEPPKYDYQEIEEYYNSENASVVPDNNLRVEYVDQMMGDEMSKAFNELPDDFREIITLCDLEDFKYEEISQILNIPIGTVRSRLHRARNALKEKIRDYAKSLGYTDGTT